MIGCERVFRPKRKNQLFCSPECRSAYFSLARRMGVAVIEGLMGEETWAMEALKAAGSITTPTGIAKKGLEVRL